MTLHVLPSPFKAGDPAYTEGDALLDLNRVANVTRELMGGQEEETLTISAFGAVTPTSAAVKMLAETPPDDILRAVDPGNHPDGRLLLLRSGVGGTITVQHLNASTGPIDLVDGQDFPMVTTRHGLLLQLRAGVWCELQRWYGPNTAELRAFQGTPDATETLKGIVELANAAESSAASGLRALTTSGLANAAGANGNGRWFRLPGGICVQWGSKAPSATVDVTVTLPLAFDNVDYALVPGSGFSTGRAPSLHTKTATNFQLGNWTLGGVRSVALVDWIAVGLRA